MSHPPIEMGTVHVYGVPFEVPQVLLDEYQRLRALERQMQDEEGARLRAAYIAEHGPLSEPPPSTWVLVDHDA